MIHRKTSFSLVLLALVLFSSAKAAPDWPEQIFSPDSALRSWPTGLEVEGDRLFLTTEFTISMFDVSDPSTPIFLGASLTSGNTQQLAVQDGKAFTVEYHGGVMIFDGDDPNLPLIGTHEVEGSGSLTGVGTRGDLVFASGHGEGLGVLVLDASLPSDPQVEAAVNAEQGGLDYFAAEHIRIIGDRIYMAGHDDDWGAFAVFSYNPGIDTEPQFLGAFRNFDMPGIPPTGASRRVEVKDDVAFINDTGAGLFMVDVSDPTDLKQIVPPAEPGEPGQTRPPQLGSSLIADDFAISGNQLVVLRGVTFEVRDISNPRAPKLRAELDLDDLDIGFEGKVTVDGTIAFVAGHQKVAAIDFSNPSKPVILGSNENLGIRMEDIQIVGDLAYVASNGIVVYDISDPEAPFEVRRAAGNTRYYSLVVEGQFAVARTLNPPEFHLFDLGEDGRRPRLEEELERVNFLVDFDIDDGRFYYYFGNSNGGVRSFDLSSTSGFTSAGFWPNDDVRIYSLNVEGNILFAGTQEHGLGIFDFTDRNAPTLIGSLEGIVTRMIVDGNTLYALRWSEDFTLDVAVIDISDLSNPILIGSVQADVSAGNSRSVDLALSDGFLYVPLRREAANGLIFDVSDPTDPRLVRECIGTTQIDRVAARGSHLFVASGYQGLQVYDTTLGLPEFTADSIGGLDWSAPEGILFPVQGSHDLLNWIDLGRYDRENLNVARDMLGGAADAPSYFRALER